MRKIGACVIKRLKRWALYLQNRKGPHYCDPLFCGLDGTVQRITSC